MFTLPDLPYAYDALSPAISANIMELHHSKHHQGYVDKLNLAIGEAPNLADMPIVDILKNIDSAPESVRLSIRNNGGGHYNHSLFWKVMSPDATGEPDGQLKRDLDSKYGSFDEFVEQFNKSAVSLFGSGWVWLTPELDIVSMPNQDNPIMFGGHEPLMGLDVWEHAYYLDYKNKRADYIQNWWSVVNWTEVESRYTAK